MRKIKNIICPTLAVLILSLLSFNYKKITSLNGQLSLFEWDGTKLIIAITIIAIILLCFHITALIKKYIFKKYNKKLYFRYDILLLFAIFLRFINIHFEQTDNLKHFGIVTYKYYYGIVSPAYGELPIILIAILLIIIRINCIINFYIKDRVNYIKKEQIAEIGTIVEQEK